MLKKINVKKLEMQHQLNMFDDSFAEEKKSTDRRMHSSRSDIGQLSTANEIYDLY